MADSLRSTDVAPYGRVHYPRGSINDAEGLFDEVSEYFEYGAQLTPGSVVFDVGANIGAFALYVAQRLKGDVRLFCFEPAPPIFEALEANFDNPLLAGGTHRRLPVALTAAPRTEDEAEFYFFRTIPADSTYDLHQKRKEFEAFFEARGRDAEQSARRNLPGVVGRGVGRWMSRLVARVPRGPVGRWAVDRALGLERYRCRLATLDEIIAEQQVDRIDLLKVDVEGAELDVLRGVGAATWPKIQQVVLEGHDVDGRLRETERLLRDQGFVRVEASRPALAEERGLHSNFLLTALRS